MNDSWLTWKPADVRIEEQQAEEEGRDLSAVHAEIDVLKQDGAEKTAEFQKRVNTLLDRTIELPFRKDYRYEEPNGLEEIRFARPYGSRRLELDAPDDVLADKIRAAWLGRCAGCLLGKPFEGLLSPEIHSLVRSSGNDFLTDYIWRMGPSQQACENAGRSNLLSYWPEIHFMPHDDDTSYTIIGFELVKQKGIAFCSADVARFWMMNMPLLSACTAERAAYRNFANQIDPPASAVFRNPYREWIGAQIRADFFGYAALGRPELAAELAWRDAAVSHVRNGIYGEMWAAAMLAAAAAESDPRRVIETGLGEVPAGSRFTEGVRTVLGWHDEGIGYTAVCERLHGLWDERNMHHWCHTISNAQVVTAALLWSGGDFESAVTKSVWPGFDTDCNGATVGSVMGMILGTVGLSDKWTGILNDTVQSKISGYNVSSISRLAREMFQLFVQYRDR